MSKTLPEFAIQIIETIDPSSRQFRVPESQGFGEEAGCPNPKNRIVDTAKDAGVRFPVQTKILTP